MTGYGKARQDRTGVIVQRDREPERGTAEERGERERERERETDRQTNRKNRTG